MGDGEAVGMLMLGVPAVAPTMLQRLTWSSNSKPDPDPKVQLPFSFVILLLAHHTCQQVVL